MLQLAEEAFDLIALAIEGFAEARPPFAVGLGGDVGDRALVFDQVADVAGIVSLVAEHDGSSIEPIEEGERGRYIVRLSALAGNIVLQNFDCEMNAPAKGLRCIRYIDDFILVGRSQRSVIKGMATARSLLAALRMDIYDAEQAPTMAFVGQVGQPFEFLGRKLILGQCPPGEAAKRKFCRSINELIHDGQTAIHKAVNGRRLGSNDKPFGPTVVAINNAIRGWRGCYRYSNCSEVFDELDQWIRRRLIDFEAYLDSHAPKSGRAARIAALGLRQLNNGV